MIRIPLRNRAGEVVAHTLIDDEDAHLDDVRWYRLACGYVGRTTGSGKAKRVEYLHRVITDAPRGSEVDHLNHDPLDNRRANLRITTKSGNMQNLASAKRGRALPRNVYLTGRRYKVAASIDGQQIHVGYFATVAEADRAARAFRAEHMPFSAEAAAARAVAS